LKGGGGSWKYTFKDGKTHWEQTNTLILKYRILHGLFGTIVKNEFSKRTKRSMQRAKLLIEKGIGSDAYFAQSNNIIIS